MQPVLFTLGPLSVYSSGVFIALGFAAGGSLSYVLAKRARLSTDALIDYFLYAAVAGLIGARLWDLVFTGFDVNSFWQAVSLWSGGLSLQGGLLAAGLTLWIIMRRHGQPVARWFDILTIGLLVGLAIGKVGSFLYGDSFGKPTNLPWGVEFTDPLAPAAALGTAVHPLQLYAAAAYAVIAVLCYRLYRTQEAARETGRPGAAPVGNVFLTGMFLLATAQFILEFVHAPAEALVVNGINVVTAVSLGIMAVSGYFIFRQSQARGIR